MNRAFRRMGTFLLTVTGSAIVAGCATVEQECPDTKYWNPQKRVMECGPARYSVPAKPPAAAVAPRPAAMTAAASAPAAPAY